MLHPTQAGFHRENFHESTDTVRGHLVGQMRPNCNFADHANQWLVTTAATEARSIILKTFISNLTDVASHRQIPAWNVIIKKLDFQSQMKISQQNQQLEDLVRENAEYELQKFRRHIKDDKYM